MTETHLSEPSQAEMCKSLLIRSRHGVLSTISQHAPGFPFGTLVQYALTPEHEPLLLVSRLAEHTKNFLADPRVSLCVSEPSHGATDQLAHARLTAVGSVEELDKESWSAIFLARHPEASLYVKMKDFLIAKIAIHSIRYVGGFGVMSWVDEAHYREAPCDPVAAFADSAIAHMNEDHQDAMQAMIAHRTGTRPQSARLVAVDRHGFRIQHADQSLRFSFGRSVETADELRKEMVRLTREARS